MSDPVTKWLDEVEARVEAATPGPWEVELTSDESFVGTYSGKTHHPYDGGLPIVDHRLVACSRKWPHNRSKGETGATLGDLKLMANARTDIPHLLAVARAAQAVVEAYSGSGAPDSFGIQDLDLALTEAAGGS